MIEHPPISNEFLLDFIRKNPDLTAREIASRIPVKRYRSERICARDIATRLGVLARQQKAVRTCEHPVKWRVHP